MAMLKHIRDPGPMPVTNVKGEPLDERGRSREEVDKARLMAGEARGAAEVPAWGPAWVIDFGDFILGRLQDPSFSKGMAGILCAIEIRDAVVACRKTGWLSLAKEPHYDMLSKAVREPDERMPYNPMISMSFAPYLVAVDKALDELPPPGVRAGSPNGEASADEAAPS